VIPRPHAEVESILPVGPDGPGPAFEGVGEMTAGQND
jgi:hypothetical protein